MAPPFSRDEVAYPIGKQEAECRLAPVGIPLLRHAED